MMNHERLLVTALIVIVLAFCVTQPAFSQTASATLSGTVLDQNGAVVPDAAITVENIATALKRETTTNDEGYFTVPLLPPATYAVTVQRTGFMVTRIDTVVLNVGDQKGLKIQLKTGDVKETVVVTGEAPLINQSPAVGTVVDRQFVANIPLNGRSFQSLITLTPGVVAVPAVNLTVGQFSVNGQRASANAFIVDGASANFGATVSGGPAAQAAGDLPGLTTLGTTQSLVSIDAMQEFKIQTSTYAAEYGRQPGGQISIVTRSGEHQFHGSAFEYLRNDVFDANDWFGNANRQKKPPERQNDFGGTFSGPVPFHGFGRRQSGNTAHNQTFFFFSYEGLRLRLPRFNLTNVPSLALRNAAPAGMQPILNGFPLPNGKDLGNGLAEFTAAYSDPSNLDALGLRVDHTINGRISLFGRYSRTPSETITRRADVSLSQLDAGRLLGQTLTLGATVLPTSKMVMELRVNFSGNHAERTISEAAFGGAVPTPRSVLIPSQYDSPTDQVTLFFSFPGKTSLSNPSASVLGPILSSQKQFNIVNTVSYSAGSHRLKFGIDYRRLMPVNLANAYTLTASFTSQQQVLNATVSGSVGAQRGVDPIFSNLSVFGQDSWQISPHLTIDAGARWDINPAPTEANGNDFPALTQISNLATMQLAPLGTRLWRTRYTNFAPRFGVAYQFGRRAGRETVVRGGFGLFYDTGNETGIAGANQFPFFISTARTIAFPLLVTQVAPPPLPDLANPASPYGLLFATDPNLKTPYTWQWNVAVQQSLGQSQALTVSYVGAAGRHLLQNRQMNVSTINPKFTLLFLTTNQATSDYNALQAQFQRRLSRGLQALVSYTWSHALDDDSSSLTSRVAQHGNASFDIRHVLGAAVTYDIPTPRNNSLERALLGHWSIDTSVHAQTAMPVDIVATTLVNPVDGSVSNVRPNVIPGVPWYVDGSQYPGGRIINNTVPTAAQIASAGCSPLTATAPAKGPFCTPPAGQSGNLGRNQLRALGAWQVDSALRRQFRLTEKFSLQFRAEAFNLFNHPNFGAIQTSLSAANFGQATNMLNRQLGGISPIYQIGGPRSFQFALKLLF